MAADGEASAGGVPFGVHSKGAWRQPRIPLTLRCAMIRQRLEPSNWNGLHAALVARAGWKRCECVFITVHYGDGTVLFLHVLYDFTCPVLYCEKVWHAIRLDLS